MFQANKPLKASDFIRFTITILFIVIIILWFRREISFADLFGAIQSIEVHWLIIAILFAFINQAGKALRWKHLLSPEPDIPAFFELFKYILTGQLVNLLIPGRVGDVGRAVFAGKHGPGTMFSLGTVALEKVFDFIIYAFLASFLFVLFPMPDFLSGNPLMFFAIAVGGIIVLWGSARYYGVVLRFIASRTRATRFDWFRRLIHLIQAAGNSLEVFKKNRETFAIITYTVFIWYTSILVNLFLFKAFDLQLTITAALFLRIILQVGISANLVPGTIGVFEFLCVLSLQQFRIPYTAALGYGLVLHTVILLPLLTGGLITLFTGQGNARRNP